MEAFTRKAKGRGLFDHFRGTVPLVHPSGPSGWSSMLRAMAASLRKQMPRSICTQPGIVRRFYQLEAQSSGPTVPWQSRLGWEG